MSLIFNQRLYFLVNIFTLCAVINLPGVITLRYFLACTLFLGLLFAKPVWCELFKENKALLIFIAYVYIHLFFITDFFQSELAEIHNQWLYFILFSMLGWGVGVIAYRYKFKNFYFNIGIAFTIPILIHLAQFFYQWVIAGVFPFGYWGIFPHHEMLGYASIPAILFLISDWMFFSKTEKREIFNIGLIGLCIFSTFISNSRAGFAFSILTCLIYLFFARFFCGQQSRVRPQKIAVFIFVVSLLVAFGIRMDSGRWTDLSSRLLFGWEIQEPLRVICDGTGVLREELEQEGLEISPQIEKYIQDIDNGDGARVLVARAAVELIKNYPLGVDGSKDAYSIAANQKCGHPRSSILAHAHDGWLGMALAIGIPGAIIYCFILLTYLRKGFSLKKIGHQDIYPEAVMLVGLVLIWSLRAVFDDVFKDHMFQMQGFLMSFLFACLIKYEDGLKVKVN